MLVKCIRNNDNRLIGQVYVVYAMVVFKGVGIYLMDEHGMDIPFAHDIEDFEIIDNRISKHLCLGNYNVNYRQKEFVPIFSFKEWAEDQYFRRQLFDSDDYTPPEYQEKAKNTNYQHIFNTYKKLMDYEFFNPNLLPQVNDPNNIYKLEKLDDKLVMCWNCEHAWEIETNNEMIECERCHNVYVNPIFPELLHKVNLFFENRDKN